MTEKLALFESKTVRRIWHDNEWYFSVVDIIKVLTESPAPRQYWGVLKQREPQLLTICLQLKLMSEDNKKYATDCVNSKNALRLIQSIPSKKAEPFKMWLAQVGKERIDEIENPELATQRTRELYKAKGYSDDWIEKRVRSITIREELTDEWSHRGVTHHTDFAILTSEISKATFGMTPSEYKDFKSLKRENLRDHMTDLELIFSMLGERATTEITQTNDSRGFQNLRSDAKKGGQIAGDALKALEKQTSKKVSQKENFLQAPENQKRLKE